MAKAKESKAEQQQRSDAAEQAHRLAHELGAGACSSAWRMVHRTDMSMDITIQIPKRFPIDWQEPLDILEAVKRMVDREEDCSEILTQLAAVRSAINNAGKVILMDHLNHCIVEAVEEEDYDKIKEFGDAIQKFVK